LTHGLRGDLVTSSVGVEFGTILQSGVTADVADGATASEVMLAIRSACDGDPVAYLLVLELVVLAGLDELQVIARLDAGELGRASPDLPPAPPRRSARRRR
jgi:hypothetical protein